MPPIRTPLRSISGNVQRGRELTPYKRGIIIRAHRAGMSLREIELDTKHSRKAVRGTIALYTLRTDGASLL